MLPVPQPVINHENETIINKLDFQYVWTFIVQCYVGKVLVNNNNKFIQVSNK